jgi:hypothetical protein
MLTINLKVLSSAIALALVAGCSSNEQAQEQPNENTYINQATVDELVAVEPAPQKHSQSVAPKETTPYSKKNESVYSSKTKIAKTNSQVKTSSYEHNPSSEPQVSAVQRVGSTSLNLTTPQVEQLGFVAGNWASKPIQTVIRPFAMNGSDSYKETMSTWLNMEGYTTTQFILSKDVDKLLKAKTPEEATFYDDLPNALNRLGSVVSNKDIPYGKAVPHDFKLYVSLNNDSRTATVYSVNSALEIHHSGDSVDTKLVEPFQSYQVFKNETYEQALYRWIGDVGYHKFGKLIDANAEKVLSQKIKHSDVINENFAQATTLLMLKAVEQAKGSDKTDRDGFLSDKDKDELELHLFLNDTKLEAILTSTNQPVQMFTVSKGSLQDNFHRLAHNFGWNTNAANPRSHFMSTDYEIDFSYPIVSEKGNIQRALTDLLDGFPGLRGAIVPSTRTAYVIKEK